MLTYSDYRTLYQSLIKKKRNFKKKLKIAILSSFTTQGLDEILFVKCLKQKIAVNLYQAPYNQYQQEIINSKSKLYAFNPDLVILIIDPISFLGDYLLNPYQHTFVKRKKIINLKFYEMKEIIYQLRQKLNVKIILHNFNVPNYSPLGILENKQQFGFQESIRYLNSNLQKLSASDPNLFIFDYDAFCSKRGSRNTFDHKMYYLADMRLSSNYLVELCDDYLGFIKPLVSMIKKCIVLDLDNTLWGGILGEVGLSGIQLGPTQEGRSYWEFQKYLLSIHQQGIILAINSRNNIEEVLQVLRTHPYMILKEEHFAAFQVNWQNKVTNMRAIARELNIGLNSFVFLDDDPYNRDLIRKRLSEVTVVDLPEDKSLYLETLTNLNEFNRLQITWEDKNKGKMYLLEKKRQDLEKSVVNIDEFVRSLDVLVTIERANEFNIPRISQLSQKTNQFNMTTRRYLEDDIIRLNSSREYAILSAKVTDKFGDYGLTGVVIIQKKGSEWIIDTFLLSCRVLGRKVEEAILYHLIGAAKKQKIQKFVGQFINTKKNKPAKEFYKNNNFRFVNKIAGLETWEFDFTSDYKPPEYIKIESINNTVWPS